MEKQTPIIKIAIVDDDVMVSALLRDFFERTGTIKTVYIASSGNQFLEEFRNNVKIPDVILLDLRMRNGSGLEVLEELSRMEERPKIIVMSSHYDASYMGQMLKLGCDAFLPKEIDPEELIEIIHKVYEYGHYFLEEQIVSLRKQVATKSPKLHLNSKDSLSERELDVLELLCQQLTTKEIADRLFISPKTVEMHKGNLLIKTGVRNSVGLIMYAVQNKLIDPNNLILLD
ncbi:response regulator transcription factor [Tenacibaculum ovolyticum]|uniref:response regulator transcription factor n=1 Tax=Tenacibaculum ovolyticum TaxID=104270 RepID=UPI0022F3D78C|nr:response regulator transcription factor [Tenacibaculum ovolyticum]WBX77178.1 response regulator transcription factor [Tenacibaculum ovolyticum]